jgi:Cysteine sulfinate desulfinase/cysteine desulfurase and related enzymes
MIEHSSVYETFKQLEEQFDFEVTYLPVDEKGRISLSQLEKSIRSDTILVSIMMVNNEVGIINPINEIKKIVKLHQNINLHVDMVQALGKIPINLEGIDLSTFSAHKIYGLKGSGILVKKQSTRILPLVTGGQQEFGLRPGTSNAATNIVLAKTIRLALNNLEEKYYYVKALNLRLREYFEQLPNVIINTPKENSTPYLLNISLLEYKPEVIMNALEELKIYVSTKSACSTKKIDVSRTLRAMNVPEIVGTTALRISLSHLVKKEDIDYFIQSMNKILIEIKKQRY